MGLLNHLFGSTESIAKEIGLDEQAIVKSWKNYLETVSKKKVIIEGLHAGENIQIKLQGLKELLELELLDISNEERDEAELIADLEVVEYSQKVKRVQKLEQCLGYVATKYEYVYQLLHQLHSILKSQMHLLEKLRAGSKNAERLISHIKSQFELEIEVINKIKKIGTFDTLFLALIRGEHIIRTMDSREKRLLKKMQAGMKKIFSDEKDQGITYNWAIAVFDALEDKVHEAVAKGLFPGYHPDIDFEFANRPEFFDLVRETIQKLRKREISEQMINVFVHLFREWYNHERD